MRRRNLVAVLAIAALTGCDSFFVQPEVVPSEVPLSLSLDVASATIAGAISDKVTHVRVTFTRADGFRRDTLVALQTSGTTEPRARLLLQPSEIVGTLRLQAVLMGNGHAYYQGEGEVDARGGVPTSAVLVMNPWVSRISVALDRKSFDALGDTVRARASVHFPSGDTIPGLNPRWTSDDPSVVSVTAEGLMTTVGNGETLLRATYGEFSTPVSVTIRQVAVSIYAVSPANPTVVAGRSLQLGVEGADRLGHPLVGAVTAQWSAEPARNAVIAVASDGLTLGLQPGKTTVRATVGTTSKSTQVTVTAPPAGEPPVLAFAGLGGLYVGDLGLNLELVASMSDAGSPTWAPDHRHIAFVRNGGLYLASLSGDTVRVDTGVNYGVEWPEYSADGGWIYFSNNHGSGFNSFRLHPDGSVLAIQIAGARMPSRSPVSADVAYVTANNLNLNYIDADGHGHTIGPNVRPATPVWSPDGKWIAFLAGSKKVVALMHPDGSNLKYVPGHGLMDGISWSPDGRWLIGFDNSGLAAVVAVNTAEMIDLNWYFKGQVAWWR